MRKRLKYISFLTGENCKRYDGEKKYFSTGAISGENDYEYVTFDNKPSRANVIVKQNDILIAKMSNTNKTTIADKEMENNIYSTGFAILNSNSLINKYLYYLLSNYEFNEYKNVYSNGTTQVAINDLNLMNIKINYMKNKEYQRLVVSILDKKISTISKVLDKLNNQIEVLKKYKNSLITETIKYGLKNEKTKIIKNEYIKQIASSFYITKVKYVCNKITDGAHESPETENGAWPFLSTVNIVNGKLDFNDCLKTSDESFKRLVKQDCKPIKGDILISKDGTIGKTVYIDFDEDYVVASSLVILRPIKDIIDPRYLKYNLDADFNQEYLKQLMTGSALKRVSVEKNANLYIVLASKKEQEEISDYLDKKCDEIETLIINKQLQIEKMEQYKESLIYEYVTGKKRVKGAEELYG